MTTKIGHYEILEEIGRGGMGVVYRAHEPSLNRTVALKVLGEHLARDAEYITRFQREAQAAAALNHPNIIQVHAIGEDQGRHYFAMEYVDGTSVQELIRRQSRIEPDRAADIILQAAKGLAAAHDKGLIHRDIKPANLMLDRHGLVKIADFGLALRPADQTRITSSGLLMGTPGYLAPEQCLDRAVDPRTDIYALGVTFFEMLTGKAPFTADSPAALIRKIVDGETPDPATLAPDLDPELRRIVLKMMARDPEERYQTCYQVAADLAAFLRSHGSGAQALPPVPPPPPGAEPPVDAGPTTPVPGVAAGQGEGGPGRSRVLLALVVVILLAILALAGGGYVTYRTGALAQVRQALARHLPFLGAAGAGEASQPEPAVEEEPEGIPEGSLDRGPAAPELASGTAEAEPTAGASGEAVAQAVTRPAPEPGPLPAPGPAGAAPARESSGGTAGSETLPGPAAGTTGGAPVEPPEAEPAPVPPPPGVVVMALGDPLLGGAVEHELEKELAAAGVQLVDEHGIPELERLVFESHGGRVDLEAVRSILPRHCSAAVIATVEPVAERQLRYMGRSDTAWTADVLVSMVDSATGETVGAGCRKRIEYTTVGVAAQAEKAMAGCGRRLAPDLWGR